MIEQNNSLQTRYGPIILGFIISLVLTLGMVHLARVHEYGPVGVVALLLIIAAAQGLAQLICMMHLGFEKSPKYNTMLFLFMLLVIVIVVVGSLVIMANVQYNEMLPVEFSKVY